MLTTIIKEAKEYLHYINKDTWFSFFIFVISAVAGFYFTLYFPEETRQYLQELETFFDSISQQTDWETFLAIFQNNAEAMLTVIGFGIFAGIFSVTFLITNGFMTGVIASLFSAENSLLIFIAGILPHGIIELPCMFFAAAIGFKIGKTAIKRLVGKKVSLTKELADGLKFAILIILPLLLVAAFIETYITPFFITLAQLAIGA